MRVHCMRKSDVLGVLSTFTVGYRSLPAAVNEPHCNKSKIKELNSFFFLDSESRSHVEQRKSPAEHVRDAEVRSAGLLLTLDIPPCPKDKGKSQLQSQYISPGQNTLHVGTAVSYCAIHIFGSPDRTRIRRAQLQRNKQKIVKFIMNSS